MELSADRSKRVGSGGHGWACRSASRPGLWRGAAAAFAEEERCDLIGGTGGEGGEGKVGPGREGLMALASAGCEMPSSSYTAGPRPQLPGLWAAELASVASTQALQRDGWRDCEAGGSGRRGWARARNRLARSAGGCARARRARAWQAEQARHMVNPRCRDAVPLFRDHFVRPIEGSAGSPMLWS